MIPAGLIDNLQDFRPLWPGLTRILVQLAAHEPDHREVRAAIMGDPILTSHALRLANSVHSGSVKRIASVEDAIVRIGIYRLLQYLAAHGIHSALGGSLAPYGYEDRGLWRHSMSVAVAARTSAEITGKGHPGIAYTAGLLHDIGKLAMGKMHGQEVESILQAPESGTQVTVVQREREHFGYSHAELGEALARSWGIPDEVSAAIGAHHGEGAVAEFLQENCDLVLLGDVIAYTMGEGLVDSGTLVVRDQGVETRLGIDRVGFEYLCSSSFLELHSTLNEYT